MGKKETVGVRLPQDKVNRIEELAEKKNISKSDATRRLINKGIEFNDSGIETLITDTDSDQPEEDKKTVADGGQVFRGLLNTISAIYATATITIFIGIIYYSVTGISMPFPNLWYLAVTGSGLVTAFSSILLYSEAPEKADLLLYSSASKVPILSRVVA